MSANGEIAQAINIFFCYAHEDEPLRNELEKHLRILKRQGHIMLWHDREISAGTEWEREISIRLNTAQIILLLISPDFMDSDYCYGVEMEQAIKRHNAGEACVLPIILRPVHWEDAPFSKLQVLPTDGRPVTRWIDRDEAFLDVAREIRKTVKTQLGLIATRTVKETKEQWITKGNTLYQLNNYEEALKAFEEAYALDPLDTEVICKKGNAFINLKQYDKALKAFEQAVIIQPDNAFYHFYKGIVLSRLTRYQEALSAFEQATQLRPDYKEALQGKDLMIENIRRSSVPVPPKDNIDKFTKHARNVLNLAQEEAQRFQHNYIGTEHLLLGLVSENEGVAAQVLASLGVELIKIRAAVEFVIGRGERIVLGEIGLTPRAKKVIELAVDEARRLQHNYIGTEHFLLGVIREGEGIAAGVLESLGVNLEKARTQTIQTLSQRNRPPDRFDKFTEPARKVLSIAQEEAQRFQHANIGTEHLLLGMIREGEGVAAQVLTNLGVDLNKARSAVEFIIGRGDSVILRELGLTPRAKKVVEQAVDEARHLNHHFISTEHLLLGLIHEDEGIAVGVLESLGVDIANVRTQTLQMLRK